MELYCTLTYQPILGEENSASDSRDGPRVVKTVKGAKTYLSRIGEYPLQSPTPPKDQRGVNRKHLKATILGC
jgi:hypothetical protein